MTFRKTLAIALATGGTFIVAGGNRMAAATSGTITYTASGTFASTPNSGADSLKLAGEPFSVSIAIATSTKPSKTGKNWALYSPLKLTGTVHSGLLGPTPVQIASGGASIQQLINPGQYDVFLMGAPIKVVGISLTIRANITMPANTLSNPLLHPFSTVTLAPTNATLTYAEGSTSTVLAIQSGTLTAVAAAPIAQNVPLHTMDSVLSVQATPPDAVEPKLYALTRRDQSIWI